MTSFVDDNGNYLDYNGDDIALTRKVANIYDFKIKGDISQNFELDNNSVNRSSLGYYGVNQSGSPALSQQSFNLQRNGNTIMRGYVVITGNNKDKIQCFFLSGNGNWFNLLKKNIRDFNWNKYAILSIGQYSKTPVDSGMIYPMVDWFAHGDKNEWSYPDIIYVGDSTNTDVTIFPSLLPCVYLHTVVSEICSQSGLKLAGDLFDDPIYKKILITPDRLRLQWPDSYVNKSHVDLYLNTTIPIGTIIFDTVLQKDNTGFSYDTTTGAYTVYQDCTLHFHVWINPSIVQPYTMLARNLNNGIAYTQRDRPSTWDGSHNVSGPGDFWVNVKRGDRVIFQVSGTGNIQAGAYGFIEIEGDIFKSQYLSYNFGVVIPVCAVLPDMAAVDMIKFISTFMPCVNYFDDASNVLTINKIDAITDREDWSDYLVDFKTEYIGIAKNNYIKFDEVDDIEIKNYNITADVPYGGINIETDFDIDTNKTIATLPFGPVKDLINQHTKWQMPSIPLAEITIDKTFSFTSVSSSGGLAKFNATDLTDGTNQYFLQYNLFQVTCDQVYLNGVHIARAADNTSVTSFRPIPAGTTTGTISNLSVNLIESKHRLLLVITDFPTLNSLVGSTTWSSFTAGAETTHSTYHKAWFNKAPNRDPSDNRRESLAMSNIQNSYYRNDIIGDLYFRNVRNMFNGPLVRANFILPVSVFQKFDFSKMVYVSAVDISGYFFVNAINNYKDSVTQVEVELLKAK